MPDIDTDKTTVYPSENDIAVTKGEGGIGTEANVANQEKFQYPKSGIIADRDSNDEELSTAGFIVSEVGSSLNLKIDVGVGSPVKAESFIDGYIMKFTGTLKTGAADFLMTASKTNHVYLKIKKTAGKVVGGEIIVVPEDSGVAPALPNDFTKIAKVITDATEITEVIDERSSMISLPAFFDMAPHFQAGTTGSDGSNIFFYAPIIGRVTTLRFRYNIGGIRPSVGSSGANGLHKSKIIVEGPEGTSESSELSTTIFFQPEGGLVIVAKTRDVFINIDNSIGRFAGGFLKIRFNLNSDSSANRAFAAQMGAVGIRSLFVTSGNPGSSETAQVFDNDVRAMGRFMEWNAPL